MAINEINKRTGITISEIARILTEAGGIAPGKIAAACPDSDPAKCALVSEMTASHLRTPGSRRCEDRHPFVLTMSFVNEVAHSAIRYDRRKKAFVPNV